MRRLWARYSERIDAMTLRERAILFIAAAAVLFLVVNTLLIAPRIERQRRIAAEVAQQQAAQRQLDGQIRKLLRERGADPDAATRVRLAAARAKIAANEASLRELNARLVPPERIRGLLESLIARDRRLELVALKTLAVAPLLEAAADGAPRASQVYRHGVELTLRGTYLDLLGYLEQLEALPYQMFWGSVDVAATDYPTITMKLTVHTISLDRAWLKV
ncbi:MAG: hypothetical protein M5U08_09320 [Burkholderiales bacterium]|nr:hypothetical protein [Burkholderiales bacterium]